MTKDQILNRIGEYNQQIQRLENVISQTYADLNALKGAKQDCEYWLQETAKAERAEAERAESQKTSTKKPKNAKMQ